MTGARRMTAAVLACLTMAGCTAAPEAGSDPAGSLPAAGTSATGPTPTDPAAPTDATRTCPAAAELPLRQRLQQTVMVWTDGSGAVPAYVRNEDVMLGGVFVGGDDDTGLRDGTYDALSSRRPVPLLVAVDDEGGQVQRLDGVDGDLPSAREQAATMSPAEVRRVARARAERMRALGITVDLAPVVDLDDRTGGVIGDRSYSRDPQVATRYAEAFAQGLQDGGVLPTLKHFPGHGRASGDSHATLPTTPRLASLERQDLVPYREILGSDPGPWAVMVGHLVVPGLTAPDRPASLDPAAYAYLRDELGFDGLVMTDELTGMQAVAASYPPERAAAAALTAGADLLLLFDPGNLTTLLDGLERRVRAGEIPEERVTEAADRVLAVKACGSD